jgi:hypothetical protein
MTWIAGAKLLADRIGVTPAAEQVQVAADALPVFHWCNVNPELAPADGGDEVVSD